MDFFFLAKLTLSVAILAPGLVLLSVLLFVGLLMLLEKLNVFEIRAGRNGHT